MNHSVPLAARSTVSKDESREFMAVFPGEFILAFSFYYFINLIFCLDIVRDLTDKTKEYNGKDVSKWFAKVFNHFYNFILFGSGSSRL